MLAGGLGQLDVALLCLRSVVRDGDGGGMAAEGAAGLCSGLEVFPTPKMHQRVWQTEPKGRFILEQKRWGLRRLGQPGAGLVRGWCFVLAQRVDKELVGEHTSQLWVRTETLSQAWTNHPEAGRHRAGEKGFSSEDSGLELRSQLGSLNLSEPLLP